MFKAIRGSGEMSAMGDSGTEMGEAEPMQVLTLEVKAKVFGRPV